MTRLPTPGSDKGTWGSVLNDFLQQSHNDDGSLKAASVFAAGALPVVEGNNVVASSGASLTLPAVTQDTVNDVVLTANCAITLPAATSGTSITLVLKQDGTGSRTVTWSGVKWPGGVTPTLSTTAGAIDVFTFLCSNSQWYGFTAGIAMS